MVKVANLGKGGSMNGKKSRMFFLSTCLILAVLVLMQALTPIRAAFFFAAALVVFGVPSDGFRRI